MSDPKIFTAVVLFASIFAMLTIFSKQDSREMLNSSMERFRNGLDFGIKRKDSNCVPSIDNPPQASGSGSGSATSGKVFRGQKLFSFPAEKLRFNTAEKIAEAGSTGNRSMGLRPCAHWSVVTTIFEPTEAIIRQAKIPGWCLVIVGDKKSPKGYNMNWANKETDEKGEERKEKKETVGSIAGNITSSLSPPPRSRRALREENATSSASDPPPEASHQRVYYLSPEDQEVLARDNPFIDSLPWNSFGRKNIGFLFAIERGARTVWDFDDDNILTRERQLMNFAKVFHNGENDAKGSGVEISVVDFVRASSSSSNVSTGYSDGSKLLLSFNPYPLLGAPDRPSWPRGLPLEDIKKSNDKEYIERLLKDMKISSYPEVAKNIGIVQSLADHDPDIDAIYRLTKAIPFDFKVSEIGSFQSEALNGVSSDPNAKDATTSDPDKFLAVSCPIGSYAPYNAQATLHSSISFWSLLLPISVHGRVADIWRSYFAARIGREIGMRVVFSQPMVSQSRNSHNYIADLDSEHDLYMKSWMLLKDLDSWPLSQGARESGLPAVIEELWVYLAERDYIKSSDVFLLQDWLRALLQIGYTFPSIL